MNTTTDTDDDQHSIELTSVEDHVPDNLDDLKSKAWAETKGADLWVTDIPVCLSCHTANVTAYGGGKETLTVGGYVLVAETCADCEQETIQVLGEA